jgi:lipopolysaccharide transport system permease protein
MILEIKVYQKRTIAILLNFKRKSPGAFRIFAKHLAMRDIKAQYRQSYLGIVWAFITH